MEQRNKLIDQLKEQVKLLGEGNNVTSLDLGEKELKVQCKQCPYHMIASITFKLMHHLIITDSWG